MPGCNTALTAVWDIYDGYLLRCPTALGRGQLRAAAAADSLLVDRMQVVCSVPGILPMFTQFLLNWQLGAIFGVIYLMAFLLIGVPWIMARG